MEAAWGSLEAEADTSEPYTDKISRCGPFSEDFEPEIDWFCPSIMLLGIEFVDGNSSGVEQLGLKEDDSYFWVFGVVKFRASVAISMRFGIVSGEVRWLFSWGFISSASPHFFGLSRGKRSFGWFCVSWGLDGQLHNLKSAVPSLICSITTNLLILEVWPSSGWYTRSCLSLRYSP